MLHTSGHFLGSYPASRGNSPGVLRLALPYGVHGGHSRLLAGQTCVTAAGFGLRIFLPSRMLR